MRKERYKRRAFTLVELLVVIGIIAILISLLLPALNVVRQQSNTLKCGTNLRSCVQAMQMYASDNKGRVPLEYTSGAEYLRGHILWAEALINYFNKKYVDPTNGDVSSNRDKLLAPELSKVQVYRCPSFPREEEPLDYISNAWVVDNPGPGGAGMCNVTKIKQSSTIALLTEAIDKASATNFDQHDMWNVNHLPGGSEPRMLKDDRHRGKVNIAYLDGHVSTKLFKEVTEYDFHPR